MKQDRPKLNVGDLVIWFKGSEKNLWYIINVDENETSYQVIIYPKPFGGKYITFCSFECWENGWTFDKPVVKRMKKDDQVTNR